MFSLKSTPPSGVIHFRSPNTSHVLQHTLHGKDSLFLDPHHLSLNYYLGLRLFINHISNLSLKMKFLSLAIFVGLFLAACVSCSVAAKSSNNNCKEQSVNCFKFIFEVYDLLYLMCSPKTFSNLWKIRNRFYNDWHFVNFALSPQKNHHQWWLHYFEISS